MPPVYNVGIAAVTENLLKRKWSIIILRHLSTGITDPLAICKLEPELTILAMNERLRMMLRYSLITRIVLRTSAKMIDYRLTPRGLKILKMLTMIEQLDESQEKSEIVLESAATNVVPPPVSMPKQTSVKKHSRKKTRAKSAA
jgi:DNA-binding HxlR family transcriptional regulator